MNMKNILFIALAFVAGALFGEPIIRPLAEKIGLKPKSDNSGNNPELGS